MRSPLSIFHLSHNPLYCQLSFVRLGEMLLRSLCSGAFHLWSDQAIGLQQRLSNIIHIGNNPDL